MDVVELIRELVRNEKLEEAALLYIAYEELPNVDHHSVLRLIPTIITNNYPRFCFIEYNKIIEWGNKNKRFSNDIMESIRNNAKFAWVVNSYVSSLEEYIMKEVVVMRLEFQVIQETVDDHKHSWVAVESSRKNKIQLPRGGQQFEDENLVGKYPEIEDYIKTRFGKRIALIYYPQLDSLTINNDGTTVWIFRRQEAEIVINDIPRVVASVSISTHG